MKANSFYRRCVTAGDRSAAGVEPHPDVAVGPFAVVAAQPVDERAKRPSVRTVVASSTYPGWVIFVAHTKDVCDMECVTA